MLMNLALLQVYAFKALGAIAVLLIGFPLANYASRLIQKVMDRHTVDPSLNTFMKQVAGMVLKVLVAISAASVAGVETTSFVAIIGAAGFAVGLAFQGSLSNFAGGVLLLVLRPYKVGDFIEGDGVKGTVQEIGIVYTTLTTPDNKVITAPNGSLANSTITNYSIKETRRVDLIIGTAYDVPVEKAKAAINAVVSNHELVLKDPEWQIRLAAHNASSLDYNVRVWVNAPDYWSVYFDLLESIKGKFDEEGIEIPYNKLDVNLFKQE
jgi:small conductance mechanosensitive channel